VCGCFLKVASVAKRFVDFKFSAAIKDAVPALSTAFDISASFFNYQPSFIDTITPPLKDLDDTWLSILNVESATSSPHTQPHFSNTMAEAAGAPPTFKLVLVGDGGTGKVSHLLNLLNWEQRHHRIIDVGSSSIGLTIG
jgi:hypothetical protein